MLHDESVYPDPFSFKPERFLKNGKISEEVLDPAKMVFGYGRRFVDALRIILVIIICSSVDGVPLIILQLPPSGSRWPR